MIEILRELFNFIKNPTDTRIENWSLQKNAKYFFAFLGITFITCVLFFIPSSYLISKTELLIHDLRIDYKNNSLLKKAFIAIIFAPILEEYFFRYFLRYNRFFSFLMKEKTWNKIFKYLVYTSIIVFGLVHSSNYINDSLFFYFMIPFILGPQLVAGIVLTFLRVKFNFGSSVLLHICWNGLMISLMLLGTYFEKPYAKEEAHYTLKIESLAFNTKSGQKFAVEADSGKVYKASIKEYSLNHVLDSLFQYERKAEDQLLNLEVESKDGLSKEELKKELLTYGESQQNFF